MRSWLFRVVRQRVLVVVHRRFVTAGWFHLQYHVTFQPRIAKSSPREFSFSDPVNWGADCIQPTTPVGNDGMNTTIPDLS
jgi:hypothetical protein